MYVKCHKCQSAGKRVGGCVMNSIIHYNYAALYSDLLEPFRSEAFGPRLATILLLLAVVVLIGFWCFALPQALRLRKNAWFSVRSALSTRMPKYVPNSAKKKW